MNPLFTALVEKVHQVGWDPEKVLWIFPSEAAANFWQKTFFLPSYGLIEYAQQRTGIRLALEEELDMAFQEALAQAGFKGETPARSGLIFATDCDEIAMYHNKPIPTYWQKVAADKEIQKTFRLLSSENPLLQEIQRIYSITPKEVGHFYEQVGTIYEGFEKNLQAHQLGYRAQILQQYHRLPKPEKQVWVDFWRLRPLEKKVFEASEAILLLPYSEFLPAQLKPLLPSPALTMGPQPTPIQYSETPFTSPIALYEAFLARIPQNKPHKAIFLSKSYTDYEYISRKTSLPLYTYAQKPFSKEPAALLFQALLEYTRFGTLSPATQKILPLVASTWTEKLKEEGLSWETLMPLLDQIPNLHPKVLRMLKRYHATGVSPNRPDLWHSLLELPLTRVPSSEIDQASIIMLKLDECIGIFADSIHIPLHEEDLLMVWREKSFIPTGLRPLTPSQAYQENLLLYWRLLASAPQIHFYTLKTKKIATPTPTLNLLTYASDLGFWPIEVHKLGSESPTPPPLPHLTTLVEGETNKIQPREKYTISDIVTYLRCPRQYAWNQYFQRKYPALPEWKSEPLSKDLQGTLLHKVIEEIFTTFPRATLQEIRDTLPHTFPTLFKKAWEAFRQENTSKWSLSAYETHFYEKALAIPITRALQKFWDFLETTVDLTDYEQAEVEFPLPETPPKDIRQRIYGRGDLRFHTTNRTIILDIKTVKKLKSDPQDPHDLWALYNPHNAGKNLQLLLYAALSPWPSEAYLWSPFAEQGSFIYYPQETLEMLWETFAPQLEKILNALDQARNVAQLPTVPQKGGRDCPCTYCNYTLLCGVS
ncbi:MAG: PD-(D/E)XK nuclease family protein [Bacteroidia bacterium]